MDGKIARWREYTAPLLEWEDQRTMAGHLERTNSIRDRFFVGQLVGWDSLHPKLGCACLDRRWEVSPTGWWLQLP
jgi:hypothetical protein